MPDNRYTEYEKRPAQGAGNTAGGAPRRPAQGSGQTRPAQSRPQTAGGARPASSAQRPAGTVSRQPVPQRGYASSGAASRAPREGTARPSSAQARPASQTRSTSQPRPQGTGAAQRSAQSGAQQRRAGQYAPVRQTAAAQPRPRAGSPKRPVSGGSGMHPAARGALFVLLVALLMTVSVIIADKIRSAQPQPVIVMNTSDPLTLAANQSAVPAEAPENTAVPAAATDIPVAATDVPAAPTNAPVSDPSVPAGSRSATIRAIGDVIIDKTTLTNCQIVKDEQYDFSPLFELVSGVMSDADWTMINIEASLRKHRYGYMGYPQFCTPHSILEDLKAVGVDMLTMCNNHALDNYFDGLKMGLDYADAAGLAHVGAYRTQEEHDTPEVYEIGGIKVGMLNYTQYTNGMAELSDEAATEYGMRLMSGADYEGDIADLMAAGAEFTIAIMHWGEEYIREPEDSIKAVARRLVAAGADLVIGGHPHVVQPAEYITAAQADGTQNTALVVYSIGNFYSEHRHKNQPYTDNGVIFEFTLSENAAGEIEMTAPGFIPIYMWQNEGAGAYEFRAVPSGVYLNNPPAGMSGSEYERMCASYQEIVDLVGGVIEVRAD